jgi:hypothetical protein
MSNEQRASREAFLRLAGLWGMRAWAEQWMPECPPPPMPRPRDDVDLTNVVPFRLRRRA